MAHPLDAARPRSGHVRSSVDDVAHGHHARHGMLEHTIGLVIDMGYTTAEG